MKRIVRSLPVAALPFGSASRIGRRKAEVTLVCQHELPNVPAEHHGFGRRIWPGPPLRADLE